MLINAAPRTYTSNIVADADLNLEGYNVTANALYSKDNYLLTMLDYGEAFPTDVKEGDRLFAWGEDSTKSYIYTYKQGSWDAGVKPQHMQDYYIADENRTVKFYFIRPSTSGLQVFADSTVGEYMDFQEMGLVLGPDCYLMGSFKVVYSLRSYKATVGLFNINFTECQSIVSSVQVVAPGTVFNNTSYSYVYNSYTVVVPSRKTSFVYYLHLTSGTGTGSTGLSSYYEVDN